MAIAFDASAGGTRFNSTGTSLSWSHTCSGTDRVLVLAVGLYAASGNPDRITSVTYNGVAMTRLAIDDVQSNTDLSYYYLVAPATGTNTVTVNWSPSTNYVWGVSTSYTGVDQTSPIDSSGVDGAGQFVSSTITSTTTVVSTNCWLVAGHFKNNSGMTAGTGTVIRVISPTDGRVALCDSNGTVGTGSQSLETLAANAGSRSWAIASLKEAGGGGGGYRFNPQLKPFAGL